MFIDTSGWAHFVDRSQVHNALAVEILHSARDAKETLVPTSYVLGELTALLTHPIRISKPQQIAFLGDLRSTTWVEIVHIDVALEAAAWNLWE